MFPSFLSSIFGENSGATSSQDNNNNSNTSRSSSSLNEPITTKTTVRGTVQQCGVNDYAFSEMQGWRTTMEDAHLVCSNIPVVDGVDGQYNATFLPTGHVIFGVMDGHGGDFTSEYAADHFMKIFSSSSHLKKYAKMSPDEQSNVPGIEQCLRPALAETFAKLDVEIRKRQNQKNDDFLLCHQSKQQQTSKGKNNASAASGENSNHNIRFERSGSTCVVVLVTPSHIICANAGDSRAVLRRNSKTLPLSFDHKPSNVPEMERINHAGGFVKSKRVDGDLAVSRGLGDFSYKSNDMLPVELQKVVPDPEFVIYPRRVKEDEFIILACDGVWDVATNEQCTSFVQSLFDDGECDLGLICEESIDTCLDKNSRDNMTIAVVTFDGCKMKRSSTNATATVAATGLAAINSIPGMSSNIIWQRRAARQARQLQQSAKNVASRAASNVGLFHSDNAGASTSCNARGSTSLKAVF